MNLENYISQLLYRYQCVTIPGFGAFLTEIQSAQRIEKTNSFNPPKKLVSFNPLIKNNDGLLVNHVIKTERIPYESAVNYINFEIENWNAKLQEFGQFSIKNVGDFYLNNSNNIVFEPLDKLNYLTTSFGLSSFISPTVNRNSNEEISNIDLSSQNQAIPLDSKPKQNNSFYKYAAVLLISGGVGIMGANKLYENQAAQNQLIVEQRVQQKINSKIQSATFFISNPIEKIKKVIDSSSDKKLNYHLVAGSFKSIENAQKEVTKLKAKGYDAIQIGINDHGLYPVIYGSYATYEEAKAAENEIEKKEKTNSWVLTQEL